MPFLNRYTASQLGRWFDADMAKYLRFCAQTKIIEQLQFDDVDLDLAVQYSDVYDTPWKSHPKLIKRFYDTDKQVLNKYMIRKACAAISNVVAFFIDKKRKTLADVVSERQLAASQTKKHSSDIETATDDMGDIISTPLTANMLRQLDIFVSEFNMKHSRSALNVFIDDIYHDVIALEHEFSIHKNTMFIDRPSTTTGECVYISPKQTSDIAEAISYIMSVLVTVDKIMSDETALRAIKTANSLVAVLLSTYMLAYPSRTAPLPEEEVYRRCVQFGSSTVTYSRIIPLIRPFTNRSLACVLELPLTVNSSSFNIDNSMKRNNEVYESTLQERYLYYLVADAMTDPSVISNAAPSVKRAFF